jgi:hypothetical protein
MARHALGLDIRMKSFRNRYFPAAGSVQECEWLDLAKQGLAKRIENRSGLIVTSIFFELTEGGAKLVLYEGESLDREDFPVSSEHA